MNDRRLNELERLGDVTAPPEAAAAADARRRRVVGGLQSVIRGEAAARDARAKRTRIVWAAALAAAALLAVGAAWRISAARHTPVAQRAPGIGRLAAASGAVIVTHDGRAEAMPPAADLPLAADDEVTTALDARARLVLASGATVELVADTRVRTPASAPKNERVTISAGEITVHVPKLGPDESFRVETPDSLVTVHGTSFVVTVRDGATQVLVREGVVSVTHGKDEATLHAGDRWPAPAPPPVAPPPPSATASQATSPAPSAHGSRPDPSTLAEQNRLLQSALDARRRGDDARAIGELDRLLARYPTSPLAQEARVEKFRALERMGQHGKAVAEARRYLADYPSGFATDEAKSLAMR